VQRENRDLKARIQSNSEGDPTVAGGSLAGSRVL